METVLLVILIIIAVTMIGLVLLQRSEGGALGIGGGGPGALFSARGSSNLLTRATAVLAALFMILSLVLAVLAGGWGDRGSVLDNLEGETPVIPADDDLLPLPGDDGLPPIDPDGADPDGDLPDIPRAQ